MQRVYVCIMTHIFSTFIGKIERISHWKSKKKRRQKMHTQSANRIENQKSKRIFFIDRCNRNHNLLKCYVVGCLYPWDSERDSMLARMLLVNALVTHWYTTKYTWTTRRTHNNTNGDDNGSRNAFHRSSFSHNFGITSEKKTINIRHTIVTLFEANRYDLSIEISSRLDVIKLEFCVESPNSLITHFAWDPCAVVCECFFLH